MMMRMTKYTIINPLSAGILCQLTVDMLHLHDEIIELNPLVLKHHFVKALNNIFSDEYFLTWHEITKHLQYISKMTFKKVFHNMPWGLQTHIYALTEINLKNKYQIKGSQLNKPWMLWELSNKNSINELYLQENVKIMCNFIITSYVKKNVQKASAMLIAQMLKKAKLLNAEQLYAMILKERLKMFNSAVQSQIFLLMLDLNETLLSLQDSSVINSYYSQPLCLSEWFKKQDRDVTSKHFAFELLK